MAEIVSELEEVLKQIQSANDSAVFDEILVLQKFIGQPMSDHQPIKKALAKADRELIDLNKMDQELDDLLARANEEVVRTD